MAILRAKMTATESNGRWPVGFLPKYSAGTGTDASPPGLNRQPKAQTGGSAMQSQATTAVSSGVNTPSPPDPAPHPAYPTLSPRPEQAVNPLAQRQQEQAQQQVQQ
jgi:hypothetical protein